MEFLFNHFLKSWIIVITAKENIVFLHNAEDGPATSSYGIEVAQLAGIPKKVILAARKRMKLLASKIKQEAPTEKKDTENSKTDGRHQRTQQRHRWIRRHSGNTVVVQKPPQ